MNIEIPFEWILPVKNKPILLKAKSQLNQWPTEWTNGFISSLGDKQSFKGGKIAIYKSRIEPEAGYMILNGFDELGELFEIKDCSNYSS